MADMTKQECLERLIRAYEHSYDIVRDIQVGEQTYPAGANYFLRDENYLIDRKKVLSVVENFEYVYFYLTDTLTVEDVKRQYELTRDHGLSRINPNKTHMSTRVTLVILADRIEDDAKKLLKKTRFHKDFWLALHGWMEYQIAAMETTTKCFLSNPAGREVRKTLELNFSSKGNEEGRVTTL